MNRKTGFCALCVLFLILNGCSQKTGAGYTAPGGEFSFVPPEHWVMREVPGFKYQFAFGQASDGFTPNINIVDGYAPSGLDDFVRNNLQAMEQMAQSESRSLKVISQGEFTTDSQQSGVKVITETEYGGKPLRQTFYFFAATGDKKFVVTCSVLAEGGESFDKIFDSSLRTFKTS